MIGRQSRGVQKPPEALHLFTPQNLLSRSVAPFQLLLWRRGSKNSVVGRSKRPAVSSLAVSEHRSNWWWCHQVITNYFWVRLGESTQGSCGGPSCWKLDLSDLEHLKTGRKHHFCKYMYNFWLSTLSLKHESRAKYNSFYVPLFFSVSIHNNSSWLSLRVHILVLLGSACLVSKEVVNDFCLWSTSISNTVARFYPGNWGERYNLWGTIHPLQIKDWSLVTLGGGKGRAAWCPQWWLLGRQSLSPWFWLFTQECYPFPFRLCDESKICNISGQTLQPGTSLGPWYQNRKVHDVT